MRAVVREGVRLGEQPPLLVEPADGELGLRLRGGLLGAGGEPGGGPLTGGDAGAVAFQQLQRRGALGLPAAEVEQLLGRVRQDGDLAEEPAEVLRPDRAGRLHRGQSRGELVAEPRQRAPGPPSGGGQGGVVVGAPAGRVQLAQSGDGRGDVVLHPGEVGDGQRGELPHG